MVLAAHSQQLHELVVFAQVERQNYSENDLTNQIQLKNDPWSVVQVQLNRHYLSGQALDFAE